MPSEFTAPGAHDDDDREDALLRGDAPVEESSDLDDLRRELTAAVVDTITLPVEGRPGYAVTYRLNIEGRDLDQLRRAAKDKRYADKLDGVKFAALLCAKFCTTITRHGEPIPMDDEPTFLSTELRQLVGATSAAELVRKFYGLDGHVDAAARALMEAAGWGDEATAQDPTL